MKSHTNTNIIILSTVTLYVGLIITCRLGDVCGSENATLTMSETENWPNTSPEWSLEGYKMLVGDLKLEEIMETSETFPVEFPIDSVRCKTLKESVSKDVLERNINSAYPVVHEKVLNLYYQFLSHKRKFGTQIEKDLYKNMSIEMLIDRLLQKRPVVFFGRNDRYLLLDNTGGNGKFETIGKPEEEEPLIIKNYMSYDEIKLSAFLSVSSFTHFINIGDRNNCGKPEADRKKVQDEGVIIGIIGARFEKTNLMEYQDIVVTKEQNVQGNGYGRLFIPTLQGMFINFYGQPSLTYDELEHTFKDWAKYNEIRKNVYFNNIIYERRLALSIDTLLIEANQRAKENKKMAYVHVVGFGLGVWKISQHQNTIFMNTFCKRIEFLGTQLGNISDICFSYIDHFTCGKYKNGDNIPIDVHPVKGITVHIVNRDPHEKLIGADSEKLLVVSYAWDGNAFPGNEFWMRMLAASGDPACAASTQIAELHNPYINAKVCGANLRVVTLDEGVITLKEYQQKVKKNLNALL